MTNRLLLPELMSEAPAQAAPSLSEIIDQYRVPIRRSKQPFRESIRLLLLQRTSDNTLMDLRTGKAAPLDPATLAAPICPARSGREHKIGMREISTSTVFGTAGLRLWTRGRLE